MTNKNRNRNRNNNTNTNTNTNRHNNRDNEITEVSGWAALSKQQRIDHAKKMMDDGVIARLCREHHVDAAEKLKGAELPLAQTQDPVVRDDDWIEFRRLDTANAAFIHIQKNLMSRVAILNFADDKTPGGMVREGSCHQEERLVLRSNLYESLTKNKDVFPIEKDELLYSSHVWFFSLDPMNWTETHYSMTVDVISSAAVRSPLVSCTMVGEKKESEEYKDPEQKALMKNKFIWMMRAAVSKGADAVVLGAFGCGAFKNPRTLVAEIMKDVLLNTTEHEDWEACGIKKVIIAIIDIPHTPTCYEEFANVFEKTKRVKFINPLEDLESLFGHTGA